MGGAQNFPLRTAANLSSTGITVDLAMLELEGLALDEAARAPSTLKLYLRLWRQFEEWCVAADAPSLPASPETVALYAVWLAKRLRASTVATHIAAIRHHHIEGGHETPTTSNVVRRRIASIRRSRPCAPVRRAPLTLDLLDRELDYLGNSFHGMQRRALLLIGFAAALRRSELVGLNIGDSTGGSGFVNFTADGLEITITKSKSDQDGHGVVIAVPFRKDTRRCPVRALRHWLDAADIQSGPIFRRVDGEIVTEDRLRPSAVWRAARWAAKRCGYPPSLFGGHSLRAGYVTTASKAGASVAAIQTTTRHRRVETLFLYVRSVNLFKDSPLLLMHGW